jgi:hypothetical protein
MLVTNEAGLGRSMSWVHYDLLLSLVCRFLERAVKALMDSVANSTNWIYGRREDDRAS